jgi:hypothetical protein
LYTLIFLKPSGQLQWEKKNLPGKIMEGKIFWHHRIINMNATDMLILLHATISLILYKRISSHEIIIIKESKGKKYFLLGGIICRLF